MNEDVDAWMDLLDLLVFQIPNENHYTIGPQDPGELGHGGIVVGAPMESLSNDNQVCGPIADTCMVERSFGDRDSFVFDALVELCAHAFAGLNGSQRADGRAPFGMGEEGSCEDSRPSTNPMRMR